MFDKEKQIPKDKELAESLHQKTHKGPQKDKHVNQYGDKDDNLPN